MPDSTSLANLRFLVVTAFDTRYEVGYLCSIVNEAYSHRHCYTFRRVLLSPTSMLQLSCMRHGAWAKVALVSQMLTENNDAESPKKFDYIVWIDADALVLNHDRPLHEFVAAAGGSDFIVGEDMADTDLLNTGLFFCRVGSEWMRNLMSKWWEESDTRWHHTVCWDQTG
eukprot:3716141-Amphidinium_carterae.1